MRRPTTRDRKTFPLRLAPELHELLCSEACEEKKTVTDVIAQVLANHLRVFGLPSPLAAVLERDRRDQKLTRIDYLRELLAHRYEQLRAAEFALRQPTGGAPKAAAAGPRP